MTIVETLLQPFQLGFMQNALAIAVIVAVPAALLSCYLVLKGWSLMGDAVSHAVLPGLVVAYAVRVPLLLGALAAGMLCALATGFIQENSRVKRDTVLGVIFSGMFGFGIVLHAYVQPDIHLDQVLFGNILGVGREDLLTSGLIAAIVSSAILLKHRDLLLHAFDPVQARAVGLRVRTLHYGLLLLLSLSIVGSLKAVGIVLSISLLITPGAIAFLVTRRFPAMLAVAVTVAAAGALIGVYLSFFIDSAPAPTIVLVLTAVFLAALVRKMRKPVTEEAGPAAARGRVSTAA